MSKRLKCDFCFLQVNSGPAYDDPAAQTAEEELHYGQLFAHNPKSPHQRQEQEQICYAEVKVGNDGS